MKELLRILKEDKLYVYKKSITKQSKYKYVYWNVNQKKWIGQFSYKGKINHVGTSGNQYKMYKLVKEARKKLNLK